MARSAGAVEYTACISAYGVRLPPTIVLDMKLSTGAFGNIEYSFITIAPRFTLIQSSSTW